MNLSNKMMAYWVFIFFSIFVMDAFQLIQKFSLDDKSLGVGFIVGALLMRIAPKAEPEKDNKNKDKK